MFKFNFNWKTILATVLLAVGIIVGMISDVGIVCIGAIISITVGAVIGINESMKKTTMSGWKKYVFLGCIIASTALFALSSYSEQTILSIASALVLVLSVLFGIAIDKTDDK
jgi:hypothetical protein